MERGVRWSGCIAREERGGEDQSPLLFLGDDL